jgi:hypothetical protein
MDQNETLNKNVTVLHILRFFDEKGVDLSETTMRWELGHVQKSYTSGVDDKPMPRVDIEFTFETQTPHNIRMLKIAVGKLKASGAAPYVRLSKTIRIQNVDVNVFYVGAYECTYTCKAKTPGGLVGELTDGTLRDVVSQQDIEDVLRAQRLDPQL